MRLGKSAQHMTKIYQSTECSAATAQYIDELCFTL